MIKIEIRYNPTSEAPWVVDLPDGRSVEFHAVRDAKAFCRRQGFEHSLSRPALADLPAEDDRP